MPFLKSDHRYYLSIPYQIFPYFYLHQKMLNTANACIENKAYSFFRMERRENLLPADTVVYRLPHHQIFYVERGSGSLQIDDRSFIISDRQLFLMSKDQVYQFDGQSKFSGFELSFDDFFWEKSPASANNCKAVLFNDASLNQLIPLSQDDASELNFFFDTLYREYLKDEYINKPDALAAFLKIIMIKIANVNASLSNAFDNFEKQAYRKFIELIGQNYRHSHDVMHYADQLGITSRKLTDLCKQHSGKGAKDLINAHLIAEAKRSLQFSTVPVKEVSFQLNFSTPEQFSHFFKKHTQISPQQYRADFVNIGM